MNGPGLAAGTDCGGYIIAARVGSGGMSSVYLAHDGAGQAVALKLLHPHLTADPAARERLRREVMALQRLRHPSIARVLDAELDSAEAFIVTEFIDGPTLEDFIAQQGPLDMGALAALAEGIYAALVVVHQAGLAHRDLKPSNVMMDGTRPVLIDFGIAHDEQFSRVTSDGLVMGTPGYVPPEVLDGADPDVATDWWGLASICAFAATGRPPFGTRPLEAVLARSHAGDVDLNGLSARTSLALAGALRADPATRTTPMELVAELHAIHEGGQSTIALGTVNYTGPMRTRTLAAPGTTAVQPLGAVPARPRSESTQVVGPPEALTAAADGEATRVIGGDETRVIGGEATRVIGDETRVIDDEATRVIGDETHVIGRPPAPATGEPATRAWTVPPPLPPHPPQSAYQPSPPAASFPLGEAAPGPSAPPVLAPPTEKRRWGVILACAVIFTSLAATAPLIAALLATFAVVVARTAGLAVASANLQRAAGKARPAWKSALASPWHFLRALATLVPSLIVGISVGLITGGVGLWLADNGQLDLGSQPFARVSGDAVITALALAAAASATWFGPFSAPQRLGGRWLANRIAPTKSGTLVVWAVAIVVVFGVVMALLQGYGATWWPLGYRPSFN